ISSARANPTAGDRKMAATVLLTPATMIDPVPALVTPAPSRPPTRACELDDGMPASQVITFQMIAPIRAPKMTWSLMIAGSMIPLPMVLATCRPKNRKAMKLKKAAQPTASTGGSTRVATMVAIELAASCRPFRKSNSRATPIRKARIRRAWSMTVLQVLDQNAVDTVGDVLEPVDHLLQVVQQLAADDEAQGVAARHVVTVRLVQGLHARV